jgi:uncharacterized protein (TIGR03118 family)
MRMRPLASLASVGLAFLLAAPVAASGGGFTVHRLVSHGVPSQSDDPNLVNGWGLSASPTSPWWVAANGTDKSTLYDGDGNTVPLVVDVAGGPTGTVYNGTSDFEVHHATTHGPSVFLFASEDGKLRGWNPGVPASSTKAYVIADRSGVGAIYKGLAIATVGSANYLYTTDFHNARVDVFDGSNHLQHWAGAFKDHDLPSGYAPFGIQAIGNRIFVTFAKQNGDDEADGAHLGYVDAFKTDGTLVARVASRGGLNAPWGLAWAPEGFGRFSGDLLVGNFGDGRIHAYKHTNSGWMPDGMLRNSHDNPIQIPGLWAIAFGNGGGAGPVDSLYFAAGPKGESAGLFGSITHN